jgi:hypothetical protein
MRGFPRRDFWGGREDCEVNSGTGTDMDGSGSLLEEKADEVGVVSEADPDKCSETGATVNPVLDVIGSKWGKTSDGSRVLLISYCWPFR